MNGFNVAEFNAGLHWAAPEIFLGAAACALLMLDLLLSDVRRGWTAGLSIASLIVTAVLVALQPITDRVVALGGLFELDRMAQVLKVVTLIAVAVVFVYSTDYLRRRAILKGEQLKDSIQVGQRRDHRFFLTMAILGAFTVFVGYFPSYYQKPL